MRFMMSFVKFLWAAWVGYVIISLVSIAWFEFPKGVSAETNQLIALADATRFSRTCWRVLFVVISVHLICWILSKLILRARKRKEQ